MRDERSGMSVRISHPSLFPVPRITFFWEDQAGSCCGKPLCVRLTRKRKILSVASGPFFAIERQGYCPTHPKVPPGRSRQLSRIVAPGSNLAYDVLAQVGLARFLDCRQCEQIQMELSQHHGIEVSLRTLSSMRCGNATISSRIILKRRGASPLIENGGAHIRRPPGLLRGAASLPKTNQMAPESDTNVASVPKILPRRAARQSIAATEMAYANIRQRRVLTVKHSGMVRLSVVRRRGGDGADQFSQSGVFARRLEHLTSRQYPGADLAYCTLGSRDRR